MTLAEPIQIAALIYAGRQYSKYGSSIDNYGRSNQSANSVEVRRSPKSVSVKAPVKSRVTKFLTDVEIADNFVSEMQILRDKGYGTKIFQTSGDANKMLSDLERLGFGSGEPFTDSAGKQGRIITLPDKTKVVARMTSSDSRPTLEFQFKDRKYEIRYGDK